MAKPENELAREIDVQFTFHNVGQGLFYSGKIGDFNFIYDCGVEKESIDRLNLIIDAYKWEQKIHGNMYLDLLILSHLHADHISGLKELFEIGIEIGTVIMPYLTPVERLMIALQPEQVPDWIYSFWADPVTFLIEHGVNKVILIGGKEGIPPSDTENRQEPPPGTGPEFDHSPRKINYDSMPDDNELKANVLKNDPQLEEFFGQERILTKNHGRNLKINDIWFFRFFNYKLQEEQREAFDACVRNNCEFSDLLSVIKNKSLIHKLKSCYNLLKGNFNDTSIVVYHGPINDPRKVNNMNYKSQSAVSEAILGNWFFYNFQPSSPSYSERLTKIGHFLTGDINLNLNFDEIAKHFEKYFSKMDVVLIPHHGSNRNWNSNLLGKISVSNTKRSVWIASAGINNSYGHPSLGVLRDINPLGIPFYCNEASGLRICSHLEL